MLIATGLTGAHILAFNDACFPEQRQTARLLRMHACILVPLFIFVWNRGHHAAVLALVLIKYAWVLSRSVRAVVRNRKCFAKDSTIALLWLGLAALLVHNDLYRCRGPRSQYANPCAHCILNIAHRS